MNLLVRITEGTVLSHLLALCYWNSISHESKELFTGISRPISQLGMPCRHAEVGSARAVGYGLDELRFAVVPLDIPRRIASKLRAWLK